MARETPASVIEKANAMLAAISASPEGSSAAYATALRASFDIHPPPSFGAPPSVTPRRNAEHALVLDSPHRRVRPAELSARLQTAEATREL